MAPRFANGEAIALSVLVWAETPNFYSGLLPSWFTISSPFFHDQAAFEGNRRRIRQGELVASILALGAGAGASYLSRSPLPLIGTIVMGAVLIAGYEYALRRPATLERSGNGGPGSGVAGLVGLGKVARI